jgi:hypothetical protein
MKFRYVGLCLIGGIVTAWASGSLAAASPYAIVNITGNGISNTSSGAISQASSAVSQACLLNYKGTIVSSQLISSFPTGSLYSATVMGVCQYAPATPPPSKTTDLSAPLSLLLD